MTCQEVSNLLDPFIDGELDPRSHETISLHVASCSACAAAAERTGELGAALGNALAESGSRVDFTSFWAELEPRLAVEGADANSWWRRAVGRWSEIRVAPRLALAGAFVAAALLLAVRFTSDGDDVQTVSSPAVAVASAGRAVRLSRVRARAGTLAVWREPRYDTTVIWVSGEGGRP